jgi:KaiC/GvpD/RAD55 family RecA-like ATPase
VLTLPTESVPYLIPDVLVRGAVTLINGDPGVGKSFLALKMAVATALGANFLGFACEQAPCWILDKENPLGLTQQRLKLLAGGSVDPDLKIWGLWLVDQPPMLGDGRLLKMASAEKPLIVFDSLIRFHEADENDASEMRTVMAHARALAATGATVLILHHKPKSQEVRYRGSSDILAGVDMAYTLEADQGQLKLNRFKNRFGSERLFTIAADFAAGKFTLTDSDAAVERREDLTVLRDIIGRNPGLSQNKILQIAGLQRTRGHELLTKHTGVLWEMRDGPHSSRLYFPKADFQPVPAPVPDIISGTTPGTTQ